MMRAGLSAMWSHWRRQPAQLATLLLGLALATGLWSAVQAINGEARASYAEAASQLGRDRGRSLSAATGMIPLARYVALRRTGWQVSPVLEGRARLGAARVALVGVDVLTYPVIPTPRDTGTRVDLADLLGGNGLLFASAATLEAIGPQADAPRLVETGALPQGVVMGDIATVERLLDTRDVLSRLLVLPEQPAGLPPLAEVAGDLILAQPEQEVDAARLTDSFHLNLTAFGFLSFAVGLFIVHGTAGLAFQQRRAMFRTLRALGLPLRVLVRLVMIELLVFALIGGALGLILGYVVAAALLPDVAATLRGLYGAPVEGSLVLRPGWLVSGLIMALAGALAAGAQGVWKTANLPLLAGPALSGEPRHAGAIALAGLALIAGGLIAAWLVPGLAGGFALLGGLLLGAALTLPYLLAAMLARLAGFANGPLAVWFWADLRGQLPGLSLALMALLLALATNVGVGTMVSSFRLTFTGWLDQRLVSELYLTARSDAEGAELAEWLAPRVDAVLPIRFAETELAGQPARIYGLVDHPTYRDNWPLVAESGDVWARLARGEAALINEQLARRADLWPGDAVTLAPGWTLPVAAVYSDYGNPSPQAMIALPELLARFPDIANRQFGLRVAPEAVPALTREIRAAFELPADALVDQARIKALSLEIFDKTFVVTAALNLLTLGVASFAILTSLLTLWTMRLPQIAPVWALGLTRARLARLEVLRSVALAGLTALLALPLGLLLAWVLLAVINVAAFGWRLPMFLFPADWGLLFTVALAAGALAALIPARRLHRLPPSDLLKVFANER
jgi:putative ABC transport system permease protein